MIRYQKDIDDIVTLTLDMSNRSRNVINHEIWEAFLPVLEHLKAEKRERRLRGVILTSNKKTFLSGGDLKHLYRATDPAEIFRNAERLKEFLRELERPGVPVVAAINGSAIGPGFEVALACHHRIALAHENIQLGLPEVELGLIPGGGATIRLMWLLGLEAAHTILSEGRRYGVREALQVGIIDELADDPLEMMDRAKRWLLATKEGRRPWDQPGGAIPGGTANDARLAGSMERMAARLARKTLHNFPARQAILNVLAEGSKVDFATACRIESRYYTQLVTSQACKNMIKAFWFDRRFIENGGNRPAGFGKFRPRKVGVIGAGQMGSGIAYACLLHGLSVVLKDVSEPIAERGREFVSARLDRRLEAGIITAEESQALLDRITVTKNAADFLDCDLVIEAVFEHEQVKKKVTREAETYMDDYSFMASNTISIPITQLAAGSSRPEHYVGLHFFHPADQVPLVEIVRGDQTSEETIARAFDFARSIGKLPIVVKDDWGFFVARVQNTYILEGVTMLQEGFPPGLIENLGLQAGFPKGPLALADDLGLEIVRRYERQAAIHYGDRYIQHPAVSVLDTLIEQLGRTGRHKKAGFYDYSAPPPRRLWEGLRDHFPPLRMEYDRQEIFARYFFAQVIEAVWCLQEGVIHSIAAANLGSVFGWGFPANKGGVIQFIHDYGLQAFLHSSKDLQTRFGQRFRAPGKLAAILERDVLEE